MDDVFLLKLALEKLNDKLDKFEDRFLKLEGKVSTIENSMELKAVDSTITKKGEFEDELLDTKQVRKFLGISHNTLQAIVNAGQLVQKRINGHNVRYLKSNVLSYIQSLK